MVQRSILSTTEGQTDGYLNTRQPHPHNNNNNNNNDSSMEDSYTMLDVKTEPYHSESLNEHSVSSPLLV